MNSCFAFLFEVHVAVESYICVGDIGLLIYRNKTLPFFFTSIADCGVDTISIACFFSQTQFYELEIIVLVYYIF